MRIAFYAPLKAPDHPMPSGDRQMARLLLEALRHAGHVVEVCSTLRAFAPAPDAPPLAALQADAQAEVERLAHRWADAAARPDLILTYHLYYKAPDLVGAPLAARLGLPYVTAEASLSPRRASGPWAERQALVAAAVRQARLTLCFTARDAAGLGGVAHEGSLAMLAPFTDAGPATAPIRAVRQGPARLVTVAMMRPGDKLLSYRCLAAALHRLEAQDWHLTIVGDGPARAEVEAAFQPLPTSRLRWAGQLPAGGVAAALAEADLFVWPGFNEAYGLCYLEAQAAGLPVVAIRNAGVPEVVMDGRTGYLADGDDAAFAAAIGSLLADPARCRRLGQAARQFVHEERSLPIAAARLDRLLRAACRPPGDDMPDRVPPRPVAAPR